MARKSIYIKAEDEALFDELAGAGNLSSIIIEALKAHTGRDVPKGMEEVQLWDGLKKIRFVGKEIWPPSDDDCENEPGIERGRYFFESNPQFEAPEITQVQVFYTKKGKYLKYWYDQMRNDHYYKVYESLADLAREHKLPPENRVYLWLAACSGHPVIEDLDL